MGSVPPIPLPRRLATARRSRLVGRGRELQAMEEVWARVDGGDGQVMLLGGEPGAGKTRLAAEIGGALHDHGITVLAGAATKDAAVPYQPFVQLADHLFEHAACCRAEGVGDGGRHCPLLGGAPFDLGRLSAAAAQHLPPIVRGTGGDPRRDLFDAFALLLRRLCATGPAAVIVDDLHWATLPTIALFEHVVRACTDLPLLVVASFRTTAPERSPALSERLAELYRLDGVHRLDLGGLDAEAIVEFVSESGGVSQAAARASAAILRDRTGGNPFFLRELWADAQRHGGLAALHGHRHIPASVSDAIDVRLRGLDAATRATVEVAAVLGETFDLGSLMRADDADGRHSAEAADAAVAHGVIETLDEPRGWYGFAHALTRQVVLDRMPTARLQALHARVARSLDRGDANAPALYPRLAHHYLHASALDHREQALRYTMLAARQAAGSSAYEEAAQWFEQAAALPDLAADDIAEALFGAAANQLRAGDFARARDTYRRLGDMPDPLVRLHAAVGFEDANWRPGLADAHAAGMLSAAMTDCGLDESDLRYVRAMGSLGRALAFAGQHRRAESVGDRAIEAARAAGDTATIAHTLRTSLWHGLAPDRVDRELDRAAELSALAAESGDQEALGEAAHFGAMASYIAGRPADLDRYTRQAQAAAAARQQPFMHYTAACMAQGDAYRRGEFAEAERLADATLELGGFDAESTEGPHSVQMFMARREAGGLDAVRGAFTGQESFAGRWLPGMLALYTELGLADGMRRALGALLGRDLDARVADAQWPIELAFMADGAADLGDLDAVRTLQPFLTQYAGRNIVAGQFIAVFGSADRYLARFAEAAGNHTRADSLFASAVEMDRRMRSPVHVAETLARLAVAVHRRGNTARAADLAAQARAVAEPIGQLRVLRWLEVTPSPSSSAGLTGRELDVLRLLAAGLSNRDIGLRLYISANTAANHVRSILMKTGAANRTQAARYATDHHLA